MPDTTPGKRAPLGVILNAGLGTRLRPITPALPKALVPVLNRPLIDYSMEFLTSLGIRDIVLVVSPVDVATSARAYEVVPPGVEVHVAIQHEARGIGDAVVSVGKHLDNRDVAVLAADTLLIGDTARYTDWFAASDAAAGLVLAPVENPRAFGVAILEGDRVVDLEEKPAQPRSNLALVGLWLLGAPAIERLRSNPVINGKGESDLTATIAAMLAEGATVLGWHTTGAWLDAGTVDGFLDAHARLLAPMGASGSVLGDSVITGALAAGVGSEAHRSKLTGPVLLGDGTRIDDSMLAWSVIGDGARVRGARLERCVVLPGAVVDGGSYHDVVFTAAGEVAGPGAM
ncbi:MAG: sugar nucleotidyltransferase [Dehalococcoidia bacterium]|nr:sugar nucleotidyltransferase [Dehalococcoidia bacterium]